MFFFRFYYRQHSSFLFVFVLGLISERFIMFYKLIFVILLILLTEPAAGIYKNTIYFQPKHQHLHNTKLI